MADIFISYAREDLETANTLAQALADQGWSVWCDQSIPPGKTWADIIGKQLITARCVLALWSKTSVTKRWVIKEARFADQRGTLIPVLMEDVEPPFEFSDIQAADLRDWRGDVSHPGYKILSQSVLEILRVDSRWPSPADEAVTLEERIEFAKNPEPRCPVVLLLDNSESMKGGPINALNDGVQLLKRAIQEDEVANLRVEIAIISFGYQPILVHDFARISAFNPPRLQAAGNTPMGAAIELALDKLEERKTIYKNNGVTYYQPWILLISDGAPTDDYSNAARRVRITAAARKVSFYCVAVRDADISVLQRIAPEDTPPLRLAGLQFNELFKWLSASVGLTVRHQMGEQVTLDEIRWRSDYVPLSDLLSEGDFQIGEQATLDEIRWTRRMESSDQSGGVEPPAAMTARRPGPIQILPLYNVFKQAGLPTITFIEPPRFLHLKQALEQPGRGVIIEGPSGIGKTSALKHALRQVNDERLQPIHILSARLPRDIDNISHLPDQHIGLVVIDDFHRLPDMLKMRVGDYLKYLADAEDETRKLVLVGIPSTGSHLINMSHDIALRVDIFNLTRVSSDSIYEMIDKGEAALNVSFSRKAEVVHAAAGSFNIAQILCYHLCIIENITSTMDTASTLKTDVEKAIDILMGDLTRKFASFVRLFCCVGGSKDRTCIELLHELSEMEDGILSLEEIKERRPELKKGIIELLQLEQLGSLYKQHPECEAFLCYDTMANALVADDPQLIFYLRRTPIRRLVQLSGKEAAVKRECVFISYSHSDARWLERLLVHLKPLERQERLELWSDTRIAVGERWREEIYTSLRRATIVILLVSADFLASDFIVKHELPSILRSAKENGLRIVPLILSACLFEESELSEYQAGNNPKRPLDSLSRAQCEKVLSDLSRAIEIEKPS